MFSVGVLYSAQEFIKLVDCTPNVDLKFPNIFSTFSVASSKSVLEVSQTCEWVRLNTSGHLEVTDRGRQVLQCKFSEIALRIQIGHLIEASLPPWMPLLSRGRQEARKYLSSDVEQCLREAGLFDGLSDDIIKWWDTYSKMSRRTKKDSNLDVGRRGEKLTILHERNRTKREPVWQGFESNLSGFDVLSVISENDLRSLRIEVKASNSTPVEGTFYITKNEWEVAESSRNYIFHLWSLQPKPELMIVEVAQVKDHVPNNQGKGQWQNVAIPYSVFII